MFSHEIWVVEEVYHHALGVEDNPQRHRSSWKSVPGSSSVHPKLKEPILTPKLSAPLLRPFTQEMTCFKDGQTGHITSACPQHKDITVISSKAEKVEKTARCWGSPCRARGKQMVNRFLWWSDLIIGLGWYIWYDCLLPSVVCLVVWW